MVDNKIKEIERNGYCVIKNFLSKRKIKSLLSKVNFYYKKSKKLNYKGIPARDDEDKILYNLQNKFPKLISGTYGNGLIASIIFKHYKHVPSKNLADQVSQKCLKEGLLVCNTGRESIKIGPPLSINQTNILKGLKIIEKALTGVNNEISK